jgi:TPR repeat protein
MVYTGCAYIAGEGTALNEIEAFGCFKEAADKGNACGMRMLSYCYEKGIGTDEDIVQAEYWQKEAAGAGYGKDEAYEELREHVEKFIEQ